MRLLRKQELRIRPGRWDYRLAKFFDSFKNYFTEPARLARLNFDAVIICSEESPSIDYFVKPFLANKGMSATRLGINENSAIHIDWHGVKLAVIVRYLPENWVRPLEAFRLAGGQIAYFMDDDLMDERSLVNLPAAYARKIRRLATHQLDLIEKLATEFWVSTHFLAAKYARWSPAMISARPGPSLLEFKKSIWVFYHGTASHQAELHWLIPIIKAVQERSFITQFEVFGDYKINRLYRSLPRVAVLHPMGWPTYFTYTGTIRRQIGLAPLMPEPFNEARAPTKFFDFVRMGAVGLYSDVPPYKDFIRSGVDGILLPNDPDAWTAAIIDLAADEKLRNRMAHAAYERAIGTAKF